VTAAALEPDRPMRGQIDDPKPRTLEFPKKRRVMRHRRQEHDLERRVELLQAIEEAAGPQHVGGARTVGHRHEHRSAAVDHPRSPIAGIPAR
jgi:hypothetical protein